MGISNLAAFVFIIVAGISTLTVVGALTRKFLGGGRRTTLADSEQREELARLTSEVESLREEVTGLRQQVDEQAERQDFAERLLAQVRERGMLPGPSER